MPCTVTIAINSFYELEGKRCLPTACAPAPDVFLWTKTATGSSRLVGLRSGMPVSVGGGIVAVTPVVRELTSSCFQSVALKGRFPSSLIPKTLECRSTAHCVVIVPHLHVCPVRRDASRKPR